MARRSAAAARKTSTVAKDEENTPTPGANGQAEEEEAPPRSTDVQQYLKTLPPDVLRQSLVYVYRLEPKIKSLGKNKYIARYSADAFSVDVVEEEYGGGKYKFWLDTHDDELNDTFYHDAPSDLPPKINTTQFVMVDDNGGAIPWPVAPSAPAAGGKEGTEAVIREATAAARVGNEAATAALTSAISLISQGAAKAVELAGISNKDQATGNADLAAMRAEITELRKSLHDRETQQLHTELAELRAKVNNPQPRRGDVGALAESAELLGVDGGVVGLFKAIAGGGGPKEETVLEYGGKKIADAVGQFITENGPAVMTWLRERTQVQRMEVITRRQQAGMGDIPDAPPPPAPPARRPPAPQPPRTLQPENPPGEDEAMQLMKMLQQQIPAVIRYYWERDFSGEATAIVVKGNFKPWLTVIRMQFNDLGKVIELAKSEPLLEPITNDPDFPEWAKEFFEEFHRTESDEAPPGQVQ